jgi:hypothetical protein
MVAPYADRGQRSLARRSVQTVIGAATNTYIYPPIGAIFLVNRVNKWHKAG